MLAVCGQSLVSCTTRTLVSMTDRYCPECINQHGNAYGAYGRLLWSVGAINACPIHGIRLVQQTCGAESGKRLEFFRRKWLPGACMSCGSIAFQCSAQARQNATQVADLSRTFLVHSTVFTRIVSLICPGPIEYRKGNLHCCTQHRNPQSVVWGWIYGHYLPSLDSC